MYLNYDSQLSNLIKSCKIYIILYISFIKVDYIIADDATGDDEDIKETSFMVVFGFLSSEIRTSFFQTFAAFQLLAHEKIISFATLPTSISRNDGWQVIDERLRLRVEARMRKDAPICIGNFSGVLLHGKPKRISFLLREYEILTILAKTWYSW